MAWNEPGKGQDPWGGGNNKGGPPDLDQIWRRLRARFSGNGGGHNGNGGGAGGPSPALFAVLVPVVLAIWLATGLYIVQPGEKGVLLRFGAYTHTAGPGWHWHLPYPIEQVYKVDTQQVRRASNRAVMLTKNENFVDIEVSVQYRISDAMNYLFKLQDPDATVEQVLRASVREIVGTSRMNQVIQEGVNVGDLKEKGLENVDLKKNTQKPENKNALADVDHELANKIKQKQNSSPQIGQRSRAKLPDNVRKIMQTKLSKYESGIKIIAVNVQYAQPPEPVQGAFEEAIKAREEKERKQNLARADARHIVAQVQGQKAQILADARGYKQRKVERAEGEASRFSQLLTQYTQAPKVTRERLYLETMSDVLSASHLILNDGGSNSMMYLPLQKMLSGSHQNKKTQNAANNGVNSDDLTVPLAPDHSGSNSSSNNSDDKFRSRSRNP